MCTMSMHPGEKVIDTCSLELSDSLRGGHVPEHWCGKKITTTVDHYLSVLKLRAEFYQVSFSFGASRSQSCAMFNKS